MPIKKIIFISIVASLSVLSLGMKYKVDPVANAQVRDVISRSIADQVIQEIESAYASKDLEGFMALIDKNFASKARFQAVLKEYFLYVENPHIHFVIDMMTSYNNKLSIKMHWFKRARTTSGVVINVQGSCVIDFKKRPDGLKIISITRDNPFF